MDWGRFVAAVAALLALARSREIECEAEQSRDIFRGTTWSEPT